MAHDDPNSTTPRDGDPPTSDPSTAFQALVSELSEKLDEARSHLDQSGSAFRRLVEQTQSDLEATVRRELTAALPEAEATPAPTVTGTGSASLRAAVELIDGAENQAEVLSRMLEQVSSACGRSALLLGRSMDPIETQANLNVWNAVGFGRESFDGVEVEVPASWRPALVADASLQLSADDAAPVLSALGGDRAEDAVLIPFVLRDAAYAVLYADDHGRDLDVDAVQLLCFVASQAMECLAVRSARPAASIRPVAETAAPEEVEADDTVEALSEEADTEGPSTPTFFASPSLQGVGDTTDAPAPMEEDDAPTQTDGIPWPQEASDIEEPAPELIDVEPEEPEAVAAEPLEVSLESEESEDAGPSTPLPTAPETPEPIDRVTAETAAPTWIEAEPETPSEGFVVGDQPPADDTVEVIEPESSPEAPAPPPVAADSFVSAIDEPAAATPPPPPPPPFQPAAEDLGFATRAVPIEAEPVEPEQAEEAPPEIDQADSPEVEATDETPSGATPFLSTEATTEDAAPPRPAAFDTLQDTPAPADEPVAESTLPAGNETVAVPPVAPAPTAPPPAVRTPDVSAEEPAEIEVPKTPPATSPGSSEVRPPQNVDGPGKAFSREPSSGEDPRDDEARRLARLLVSELKLYNEDEIGRGKRAGNIYQHLREDIDRSRRIYEERIAEEVRQRQDFLQEELVRGLADGNPELLGM